VSTRDATERLAASADSATEPERSLRAVLDWIRARQRELRKLQDAAGKIHATETVEAKKALYWELDTVAEKINNLRYEAAHSLNNQAQRRGHAVADAQPTEQP